MTGHVIYTCNCLNVSIYLANKYYLEGHEDFRKDKFVRLKNPSLSGWIFDLNMEGVIVEYENLVRMRQQSEDWITISCHNCKTGDVYSVKRPDSNIVEYPIDKSLLSQFGDKVIVHQGTIFGFAIEDMKNNTNYSSTFHIVLNPDLPVNHEHFDKDNTSYGPELSSQYKKMKQILKESLIELEEATEKRIQAYQAEQEILLTRDKEKTMYDGAILWQTMKEVSKTFQDARRMSSRGSFDHTLFNHTVQKDVVSHHVNEPVIEQRRRSSAIRRDLFGGQDPSSYRRRSSYTLNENVIADSFKSAFHDHLKPVQEQPPQVHPLAHTTAVPSSPLLVDEDDQGASKEDQEDELFALDEDINSRYDPARKRLSIKYISSDDEDVREENNLQMSNKIESNFATSVPIHVPLSSKNATWPHPSSVVVESTFSERKPSFVGFDYAAADRRQSLNFSPRRRMTDTQDIGDREGPMVPPHIMVANTVNDETEGIFGSVPRNSTRNRPLE